MHDEANPSYTDMLDNTALGHRFIRDTFGESALPTLTWQIDREFLYASHPCVPCPPRPLTQTLATP
jgi:hypothetical protein